MNYVPNVAENTMLKNIVDNLLQGGTLHLFKSNHTPVAGDTLSTYTAIEATFGGYAAITVSSWSVPATNGSGQSETDAAIQTWVTTGSGLPETVYGVFYEDVNGDLSYAELFPTGGLVLSTAGLPISYLPVFTLVTA